MSEKEEPTENKLKNSDTLDQKWLRKLKNNKLVAFFIVIGVIIGGIATFSDNIFKIHDNFEKILPTTTEISIIQNSNSVPSTFKYSTIDTNIHVTDNASDIINFKRGDVIVNLGINNTEGPNIRYVISKNENGIYCISPNNDYLDLLRNRGPIESGDGFARSPFEFQFPNFDFKITNNSNQTIFFTQAIIKVKNSSLDPYPIFLMEGISYNMHLNLINVGWGGVSDCKLFFNISPIDTPASKFNYDKAQYKYLMNLGSFNDEPQNMSLTSYLSKEGVDTTVVRDEFSDEERTKKAQGLFINNEAFIYGVITYKAFNAYGKKVNGRLNFKSIVAFGEQPSGAPAPPSYYYDVSLDLNKKNYTRVINISQAIRPQDYDRFNISVSAPKSSIHSFDLILVYNDNQQIVIPNLHLNYFMSTLDSAYITNNKNKRQ